MKTFDTQADLKKATLEELREAAGAIGVDGADKARRVTLVRALGEAFGILIEEEPEGGEVEQEPSDEMERRVWVRVEMSEADNAPVFVAVNGDNAYIPRGVWVHAKSKHLIALQNAVQTVVDKDRNLRQIPAYPHTFRDQKAKPTDSGLARFSV
jgi:hypothetical protein